MKHFLGTIACVLSTFFIFSQEELNPIISKDRQAGKHLLRDASSFDSTFIYTADTLELPFFDDFSKNHFQQYADDYNDPTITSDERYKLLDLSNTPLPVTARYTSQQTIRKIVNTTELTEVNEVLPSTEIKVGDFSSYPPVYTQITVYPPYIIYDTVDFPNAPDTVWMSEVEFVQDSAVQFFARLDDDNAFWLDSKAEHSFTNAVNPWTLGVVTFDGTDENGMPYIFGSNSIDYNDYLTSKPVNMSGLTGGDSVYFSFLYQPQGFNDEPESVDSLELEFYAPDQQQWFQVWSAGGSPQQDFKKVHFRIIDPKFFKPDFQFRFRNYSGVSGAIDQFHIDYVRLQKSSGYQDTLFKDFSVLYPLNTLLDDFTQVPWDHFRNNPAGKGNKNLEITVRNSSNVDENYLNGKIIIENQGVEDGTITILGQELANNDINYEANTVYASEHDISAAYDFNSTLAGDHQEFRVTFTAAAQFSNFAQNDTTTFVQRFYDCYAYDDGSAEAAYGPTGIQARLAYKFTPYEDDTLVGIRMRFVPSVNNTTNDLFLLTVWDDHNGEPGNVIYEDDFLNPRQPSYSYDSLGFTSYYFTDFARLPLTGTFYVGWRQLEQQSLNIGFDRNTDQSDNIFYSTNNGVTWLNTSFEGSLMMRPVFSTDLNYGLSVSEKEPLVQHRFKVYPNPFSSLLITESTNPDFDGVQIMDLNGKIVFESRGHQREFNLEMLEKGVYLVRDITGGAMAKIVKN
ncbi:MAG: T9SS type A sorting domain-containing protein [Bacteroidota bacterium]